MVAVVLAAAALAAVAPPAYAGTVRTHTTPGLGDYDVPFYPGGTYRDDVRSPSERLGYSLGSWPASHPDIIRYLEYLSDTFPEATLHDYGESYEGRRLVYLVVSSAENVAKLDEIRPDLARLADPRTLSNARDAGPIVDGRPAVAWMAYGIHGDELSSCDAALQLAYQLVAGTDTDTRCIRDEVITIIDPLQNPDGRTRWLAQLAAWNGAVPNDDVQSLHHRGVWPQGRTNHYLFDINRDWFALVHPETRGKTRAILEWMPHYFLDCHEMGPMDTYLFSPPREPFNPFMPDYIHEWWRRVAEDQAAAFDRYGWSYYTREWNEELFPGYGSSWSIYLGSIGMLFEQAGVDGSIVKRREGTTMAYRETVHHQFTASVANLLTVAENRAELLRDFYERKAANVNARAEAFLFVPSANATRFEEFIGKLQHQRIEVERAREPFKVARARAADGGNARNLTLPAGTAIVRTNQPLKQLVEVLLTFDIRIPDSFLETEKKEVLKRGRSRVYDVTGWSMAHAYALEAYRVESLPRVKSEPYVVAPRDGGLDGEQSRVGFVFDGADDRACLLLARLLEGRYRVRCARKPFHDGARAYGAGSFLLRFSDNPDMEAADLRALAEETGVEVHGVATSLGSAPYADLGGNEFVLLEAPRIGIVGGNPVAHYNFGVVWHLVDARLGLRASTLDVSRLASIDLARYNVLVLPHNWGGDANYKQQLGDAGIAKLKDWVRRGGTLVAEGNAAVFLADTSVAVSKVRLKRQSLDVLARYEAALAAALAAESPVIDSLAVWEGAVAATSEAGEKPDAPPSPERERVKEADERARKLRPRGAVLAVDLDAEHWLAYGCGDHVPVLFGANHALLAPPGVEVAGRLAPADRVRLSGLLWEEARARWAQTAYATREESGNGQVILFATLPNFRGYYRGAERLLLNALLLGPGQGTKRPIEW
jgi:hypothetical protein